ncbi:nucleoside-triphosphate diphosphatase [Lactococcus nasutitermitis]|uniref:dITP/XTP pyrophosphatase n=1 Tax=Lactococcus nasutitermitis TaxID=1652957 RepID=A0ABV9JCW1_9LACT|nr:nucleoside-triphosphate diphosphatase [Lactococcus nasutitermitis]
MTEIFEVKTAEDWFVGSWATYGGVTFFDSDDVRWETASLLDYLIRLVRPENEGLTLQIQIFRLTNWSVLIDFIVKKLNEKYQLELSVKQRSGVIFVVKNDEIIWDLLPEKPVKFDELFDKTVKKIDDAKTLLIATRNEGKTREFRDLFADFGYTIKNLNDFPELPEIAETGMTFEENARLKAEQISEITGEVVVGDDSGLSVDLLGGLPGVWSHRFAGENPTDIENMQKLLHELASTEVTPERRSAHFHTTLVAARPNHESLVVEADWPGFIAVKAQGENGFGYDPIFLVGNGDKTAAELSADEKNKQSHRGQALQKLMKELPVWLEN